jgi:hypothetical protein
LDATTGMILKREQNEKDTGFQKLQQSKLIFDLSTAINFEMVKN